MEEFLRAVAALNDESRVRIAAFLARNGKCCVCELEASLSMPQSTLSRHLKILKDAGFLIISKVGARSYYELSARASLQKNLLVNMEAIELELPQKIDADDIGKIKILRRQQ